MTVLSELNGIGAFVSSVIHKREIEVKRPLTIPESDWGDPSVPEYSGEFEEGKITVYLRSSTAADDIATVIYLGSGVWAVISYFRRAGGGGTGNGGNNFIPYSQYGDIGTPTAFDVTPLTVGISNATPGIVTTPSHGALPWECNRPFYFSNNGDTLPSPLTFNTVYLIYCGDNPLGSNTNAPTATTFGIATRGYSTPITCILYAPNCQTAIATTTAGSGTHVLNMYTFVATAGSGVFGS